MSASIWCISDIALGTRVLTRVQARHADKPAQALTFSQAVIQGSQLQLQLMLWGLTRIHLAQLLLSGNNLQQGNQC